MIKRDVIFSKNGVVLFSILLIFIISSCKKDDPSNSTDTINNNQDNGGETVLPQGTLYFHLHTFIDFNEVDAYNIEMPMADGRLMTLSKANMYLTDIELIKLDGSVLKLSYNILKLFESESIEVGKVPVGNYKSIRFKVGLNSTTNALLPNQSKDSIILNKPDMWFGTTSQPDGYVFMNVQGTIDTTLSMNGSQIPFVFKVGTNSNLVSVSMPERNFTVLKDQVTYVHLIADYSKLFTGVNLSDNSNLTISNVNENTLPKVDLIKNNIPLLFSYE